MGKGILGSHDPACQGQRMESEHYLYYISSSCNVTAGNRHYVRGTQMQLSPKCSVQFDPSLKEKTAAHTYQFQMDIQVGLQRNKIQVW